MSGPHGFVEPPDPRMGVALGAGQASGRSSGVGLGLLAGFSVQPARCALPGCGRVRDDPIHWPEG